MEDNRVNKATFFLRKLKLKQCKEAMKEFKASESISKLEAKIRKVLTLDLAGLVIKGLGTQLQSAETGYRLGLYRLASRVDSGQRLKERLYTLLSLLKLGRYQEVEVGLLKFEGFFTNF